MGNPLLFLLALPGTQTLLWPWAPHPYPRGAFQGVRGGLLLAVLEAPAHPRSQVDTFRLGEAAWCQQAERRCEGSHSGRGGGWAGRTAGW